MAVPKKSFVIYFDSYPLLNTLPMEQRGMLFSVLMIYADRVWREPATTLEEVLEGFPRLSPEARMACGFMGSAVQRDTEAWRNKQEFREKKKQEVGGYVPKYKAGMDPKALEAQQTREDQRAKEDMERTRQLMELLKGDG